MRNTEKKCSGKEKHQTMDRRNLENYNYINKVCGCRTTRVEVKASYYLLTFKEIVWWNNHINGKEICIEMFKLDSETKAFMDSHSYVNNEGESKCVTLASNEGKFVKN